MESEDLPGHCHVGDNGNTHDEGLQANNSKGADGGSLTAAVLHEAFGSEGGEPDQSAGPICMPTRKDRSDSATMYSVSESILPQDPREMLYYCPRRHLLQNYCIRKKASLIRCATYGTYREHTDAFVIGTRMRKQNRRSIFLHSIDSKKLDRNSESYVGKIVKNTAGTEYVFFSEGVAGMRKEIGAVLFDNTGMTEKGPMKVLVIIPAIDVETGWMMPLEGGDMTMIRSSKGRRAPQDVSSQYFNEEDDDVATTITWTPPPGTAAERDARGESLSGDRPPQSGQSSAKRSLLLSEYKADPKSSRIMVLKNKLPVWNPQLRGYQLNFHGRAKKPSSRNLMLTPVSDPDKVVLVFGKMDEQRFSLDFRYPLCAIQAHSVAIALLESTFI